MQNKNLKILSKSELGFISMPVGHNVLHLCFNNLLINFSLEDFLIFRDAVKYISQEKSYTSFPDGRKRILLHTPYDGIHFSFDPHELHALIISLDEAYYMQKIYSYLKTN